MDIQKTVEAYLKAADQVAAIYETELDLSIESIDWVNEKLSSLHREYLTAHENGTAHEVPFHQYAAIWGIYVGEVLLRHYPGAYGWVHSPEQGLVLQKNGQNQISPIAKATKHIHNGAEGGDEIKPFFEIAALIMQGRFPFKT